MTQNMEKYYGFRVIVKHKLDPVDEVILRAEARKLVDVENIDLDRYQVYLHQLIVKAEETHFGVSGGIPGRLEKLNIEFLVNQKQRQNKSIQFFNHLIDTATPKLVDSYPTPDLIGYNIASSYFRSKSWFQNAIIAFVDRDLRRDRRKIKVHVRATPTANFRAVLRDIGRTSAETHLDLPFRSEVQLRLPLGDAPSFKEDKQMSNDNRGDTYNIHGGVNIGIGGNVSINDLVLDARSIDGFKKIAAKASEEGEGNEAELLEEAAKAAESGDAEKAKSLLKQAGKWTLTTANKLGLVAAETAIKAAVSGQFPG
ncbi:hypothetical protein [Yoonia sp. SDW83-1]|uniref:hypothetical protein n=1 Tax=Yoonia sp. SDW83-1 TaxID=3366945 RepID=UPI00398C26AF